MSINRGMEKDVVHRYNGTLISHKKKWNWAICRNVDGPRDCHIEWSKSEREKQISCVNTYMWNLEKWYRWSYLQSRNRDTAIENKCMDKKGEGWGQGGGELGDWDWHIYTIDTMYKIDNSWEHTYCIAQGTLLTALCWPKWEGNPKRRGYVYTYSRFTLLYSRN